MIKHVILLVLLGNVLKVGPKEASGKKYSPIHRAQFVKVSVPTTAHATTKKDLRKNVVHVVKNARKTNKELVFNESFVIKIKLENPSGKKEKADDIVELAQPKLYNISESVIDNFVESLMKKNTATINKLQKLKMSPAEISEDSQSANQNLKQLKLMKKQINTKKRNKNIQFLCWVGILRQEFPQIFKLKMKKELEVSDEVEYNECPTSCPTEGEMVCARCKDGVYKTFVSVCHMRMFNCKHPDEKLKLVARRPCILSAPYASNFDNIQDPPRELRTDDPVMRHIWCLKHYKTNDDPRCNYLRSHHKKLRLPFWIGEGRVKQKGAPALGGGWSTSVEDPNRPKWDSTCECIKSEEPISSCDSNDEWRDLRGGEGGGETRELEVGKEKA